MVRKILSVVAGYAVFVISSLALFKISRQAPHASPGGSFVIATVIYGAIFAYVSGLAVQLISRAKELKLNYILAFIIAGFAAFSLLKTGGNHWTQLLAIFVFAPASILGGLYYIRRHRK